MANSLEFDTNHSFQQQVLQGNASFANNLYQILSKEEEGNLLFSPLSIHAALAMAYQGARGETKKIMSDILKYPDFKSTALGYKSLFDSLKLLKSSILSIANKMYTLQQNFLLKEEFRKEVVDNFYSEIESINLEDKTAAAKIINEWVEEKTGGKITELVNEESLNDLLSLILINAIYFKSNWRTEFEYSCTIADDFYIDNENKICVNMMKHFQTIGYKADETLNAEIGVLSFLDDEVKMVIILPFERNGLKEVETKLASMNLNEIIKDLDECSVCFKMPKFKMESTIDLKNIMIKMGLANIFDERKANFKGMSDNCDDQLYIGKILHKDCIDVNEEGCEAAAVADVNVMIFLSFTKMRGKPKTFTVNHPAIFMLITDTDGIMNILFFGRLSHPKYPEYDDI